MKEKQPLVLNSAEPITDGGRKYNIIYIISILIFLVLFIAVGANFLGVTVGIVMGLCVGWVIKNAILNAISSPLRTIKFQVKNKIPYSELINRLIPVLTPLGMMIEKSADENGFPVITYQGIMYDITYEGNEDVFTIWWRKNVAKAYFTFDSIKTYRKIVIAMGIIGYNMQQICNEPFVENVKTVPENRVSETSENSVREVTEKEEIKYCIHCGKKISVDSVFCSACGQKVR